MLYNAAFITQPTAAGHNEKLKMWQEGRGKSKGGSKGMERKGSKTSEQVNCERDSEVRDGATETESE